MPKIFLFTVPHTDFWNLNEFQVSKLSTMHKAAPTCPVYSMYSVSKGAIYSSNASVQLILSLIRPVQGMAI